MTILILGFDQNYAASLARAFGSQARFVADSSEEGNRLFSEPHDIDGVILNGDEVGENGAIRRFEDFRLRYNCLAIVAAYAPKDQVQGAFSKRVEDGEPILKLNTLQDGCAFLQMPLSLELLQNCPFDKLEETDWKEQRRQLQLAHAARQMREFRHRYANLRSALRMLDGVALMGIVDLETYRRILSKILEHAEKPMVPADLEAHLNAIQERMPTAILETEIDPDRPCLLLIDDEADSLQWGPILKGLFAAELKARLVWKTRLKEGREVLAQKWHQFSALLLDIHFPDEGRTAMELLPTNDEPDHLFRRMPVVVFSHDPDGYKVKTLLHAGAVDFFMKEIADNRDPVSYCKHLCRRVRKAMDGARLPYFRDALEKAKDLMPPEIQKSLCEDLNNALFYLFTNPKLALFCVSSGFEALVKCWSDRLHIGVPPEQKYQLATLVGHLCNYWSVRYKVPYALYWQLCTQYRHLIAHGLLDDIPYHSLDAEAAFWSLMGLLNSPQMRGELGLKPVSFDVQSYLHKIRYTLTEKEGLTQKLQPLPKDLQRLFDEGIKGNANPFFPLAADWMESACSRYIGAHRKPGKRTHKYLWDKLLQELSEPERLAKTFGNTERDKLKDVRDISRFTSQSHGEHFAAFAAICGRIFLINQTLKGTPP